VSKTTYAFGEWAIDFWDRRLYAVNFPTYLLAALDSAKRPGTARRVMANRQRPPEDTTVQLCRILQRPKTLRLLILVIGNGGGCVGVAWTVAWAVVFWLLASAGCVWASPGLLLGPS
jgi:hypothetical protein